MSFYLRPSEKLALFRRLFPGRTDVYPLLADERCRFSAVDCDEADWREDAKAFIQSIQPLSPVLLESTIQKASANIEKVTGERFRSV